MASKKHLKRRIKALVEENAYLRSDNVKLHELAFDPDAEKIVDENQLALDTEYRHDPEVHDPEVGRPITGDDLERVFGTKTEPLSE